MNPPRIFIALFASGCLAATGCALFVVENAKQTVVIERSQRSAQGVIYFFKEELDSNNVQAATELMAHASGRRLLAVERYEIQDDVERYRRMMSAMPITEMSADTLSATSQRVHVTMDYIRHFEFSTIRLDDSWYVASVKPINAQR